MALEIEKKYLLKRLPALEYDKIISIVQHYTPNGRFRQSAEIGKCIFTKTNKTFISPGVNEEVEIEIDMATYLEEIKQSTKFIIKVRHVKQIDNLKWEIDVFSFGLTMAEVEVNTIEELENIEIPDFIQKELIIDVTTFREFSNTNLAIPQYDEI